MLDIMTGGSRWKGKEGVAAELSFDRLFLVCMILSFLIFTARTASETVGPSIKLQLPPDAKLSSADAAVMEACAITGLGSEYHPSATLVVMEKDTTPFLSERMSEKVAWKITMRDWKIVLPGLAPRYKDWYTRVLDVFVDPMTGQFLKASTRWPEGEAPIAPEPDAESGAQQMLAAGKEKYHGLVTERPAISFFDAIGIMEKQGGNPRAAKQIVAIYVVWSVMDREPMPMWVITLRGVPPIQPRGGGPNHGVHEDLRNHFRYVVDPINRSLAYGSTAPQPDRPRPIP